MAGAGRLTLHRAFLALWIGGLVAFAIVIMLSLPLMLTEVPGGISDHQAAGTAAEVNRIQKEWRLAGLWNQAAIAMIADLVFIGVYGAGSVLGGLYFRAIGAAGMRLLGTIVALAGAIFLLTDYAETLGELIQLVRFAGDDRLAQLAATMRPVKMAAWVTTFLGVPIGIYLRRKSRLGA